MHLSVHCIRVQSGLIRYESLVKFEYLWASCQISLVLSFISQACLITSAYLAYMLLVWRSKLNKLLAIDYLLAYILISGYTWKHVEAGTNKICPRMERHCCCGWWLQGDLAVWLQGQISRLLFLPSWFHFRLPHGDYRLQWPLWWIPCHQLWGCCLLNWQPLLSSCLVCSLSALIW